MFANVKNRFTFELFTRFDVLQLRCYKKKRKIFRASIFFEKFIRKIVPTKKKKNERTAENMQLHGAPTDAWQVDAFPFHR